MSGHKKKLPFTNSTLFLLPMYGLPVKEYTKAGFVDCFIKDDQRPNDEKSVVFSFIAKESHAELIEDITTMMDSLVLDMYGYDQKVVILVLRIPEKFEEDYNKIIEGRYSQVSDEYRELVSGNTETGNKIYDKEDGRKLQLLIIEKDPLARSFVENEYDIDIKQVEEVWSKFDITEETLTQKRLQQISFGTYKSITNQVRKTDTI